MRRLTAIAFAIVLSITLNPGVASADQPATGYNTAEILFTADTYSVEVPVRRGFWDPDIENRFSGEMGEGFGYDKAYHRHGVTDTNMIRYMLEDNTRIRDNSDNPEYDDGLNFFRSLKTVDCKMVDNIEICTEVEFDMIAAVNLENRPLYYDWPAGDPVGLQTVYCDGYDEEVDYKCPSWVNTYLTIA